MEAAPGFEPGYRGFADLCLATWLCRQISWNLRMCKKMERETGFEPATLALARRCSTSELFPRSFIIVATNRACVKSKKRFD